jgi:hypothetical protein
MAAEAPMSYRVINLAFAVFWLLVAAYFLRARLGPDQNAAWADPQLNDLYALLALALVLWNVTRWYHRRPTGAAPNPLATRRRSLEERRENERPAEYHPEFDFSRNQDGTGG